MISCKKERRKLKENVKKQRKILINYTYETWGNKQGKGTLVE